MKCRTLRNNVAAANRRLSQEGLVAFTWGNVSGIDRERGYIAIKPSGVPYDKLTAETIVLVDIEGKIVEGDLKPSVDTPAHCTLYREFQEIGGVVHTHSPAATAFAQACMPVPCLGTTHADYFNGQIPIARELTTEEIEKRYEEATGLSLAETLEGVLPLTCPGALAAHHGPFSWGIDADAAVDAHIVMELLARMAIDTIALNPHAKSLPHSMQEKHFMRKHGESSYYGQK